MNKGGILLQPGRPRRQFVYASGMIIPDGTARLQPFQVVSSTEDIESRPKGGAYTLSVEHGEHHPAVERQFDPSHLSTGGAAEPRPFGLFLPYDRPGSWIVFRHGGRVLAERRPSAHHPNVSAVRLDRSKVGLLKLAWTGSDPVGEPVTFSVWYSSDEGVRWIPIAVGLRATSCTVDLARLAPSANWMVRVLASNGLNTTETVSAKFQVHERQ